MPHHVNWDVVNIYCVECYICNCCISRTRTHTQYNQRSHTQNHTVYTYWQCKLLAYSLNHGPSIHGRTCCNLSTGYFMRIYCLAEHWQKIAVFQSGIHVYIHVDISNKSTCKNAIHTSSTVNKIIPTVYILIISLSNKFIKHQLHDYKLGTDLHHDYIWYWLCHAYVSKCSWSSWEEIKCLLTYIEL